MRFLLALAIALPAALMLRPSAAAWADNGNEGDQRSPLMIALTQCRDISGADARLACYDKTTATLIEAEAKHEVVVIDRAQVKEAKRRLFGIKLPISPLFTNTPDIDNIETTLRSSSVDSGGGWTFVLADGASWTQVDGNVVAGKPKAGEKVIVQRGTLGSFKLTVGNRPAVKVRRLN